MPKVTKSPFIIRKNGWKSTSMGKACFIVNTVRSSHRRSSVKKGVLRNSTKFTGKHLGHSFFFNKVAALRPATLLKKRLWHRCFPVNFAKFPRTAFLQNTSGRLLLYGDDLRTSASIFSNKFADVLVKYF